MLRVRWVVLAALAAGCSERSSTTQLLQRQSFPTVTSFSPSGGLAGTSVTVIGSGFTGATYVSFANKPASFTIDSDTQLHATVPSGAISGPIGVSTAGGSQSPQSFTVFSSATPTITGISPSSGPAGNFVTINGTGFTGLTSINFNGASTAFTGNPVDQMTDTTVQQQVPAGAMTGPITITNTLGTSNASATFTVSPTPSPTGFMPARAAAGAPVTVTGTNLAGVTGVSVGNVAASISTVGASQISFTVPANAVSAAIYLSVGSGRYSPPGVLKVTASQAPAITSLSPPATAVGQMVNIHGSGFAGVTSVTVNGAAAAFDDSSFFDATQLFVTVPAGATPGKSRSPSRSAPRPRRPIS